MNMLYVVSRTDSDDIVVDVTSFSALDVVKRKKNIVCVCVCSRACAALHLAKGALT